ncbi:MAG TPA: FG-GAP-like repeat-containing protein [Candidatus Krumholzibacteria bacterium]|nr:FG-GAP-like repeat-containing protein [Candidatus Krumholzibacteria bacterium]
MDRRAFARDTVLTAVVGAILGFTLAGAPQGAPAEVPPFTDVTRDAGITHTHGYVDTILTTRRMVLAGAAAADYDGDGWTDLYVIRGGLGPNLLYKNLGDGTFADVAAAAGVDANGDMASGALFFDANGDGALDLFVGGTRGTPNRLFIANHDGTFTDRIAASGLPSLMDTFSASAADYDRDGDLDLFLAHWRTPMSLSHLWRNDGHGVFTNVDEAAGIVEIGDGMWDWSFTANFCDFNGDGWPDLAVTGDFKTSRVFMNRCDGTFADATSAVLSDENGMGAAVGDYDNDGDMDWFVASIYDETGVPRSEWGITGNRMYANRGDGSFADATDASGVRAGGWAWGTSFADVDNDGWLDLFLVNGWPFEVATFLTDPARLFMNAHDGSFVERSTAAGVADTGQGRGVVCFDYDNDGDVDLFLTNYFAAPVLLRNDSPAGNAWLALSLRGRAGNPRAIGARVRVESAGLTQVREVGCGNNYLSQNPAELHIGLGANERADRIDIEWPDGGTTTLSDVAARQRLVVEEPAGPAGGTPPFSGGLRVVSAQPNPFSAGTSLQIDGAVSDRLTAVVYDVAGRRVRNLAGSGSGVVYWDGRDGRGTSAPAGVYWIRVSDGATSAVRSVVLVR